MHINEKEFKVNTGKGVGNELEELLIKSKKRLWIVSPWISKKYAELLIKKKEEGVDVKLITTTSYGNKDHLKGLMLLINPVKKRDDKKYKLYSWLMLGSIPLIFFYGIGIIAFVIFLMLRKRCVWLQFQSPIGLKIYKTVYSDGVPNEMMHIKSYIADDNYCLGSVNLTNKGLWDNIESLVIFNSESIVKKGADEFLNMLQHPLLKEKSMDELGLSQYFKKQP